MEQQQKKQGIMKTLTIFYEEHSAEVFKKYHKNHAEAADWWNKYNKKYKEYRLLLMKDLKRSGHKYEIECQGFDYYGDKYSKYIFCYSKKEAIFVIRTIKKLTDKYIITLKKLY